MPILPSDERLGNVRDGVVSAKLQLEQLPYAAVRVGQAGKLIAASLFREFLFLPLTRRFLIEPL
jgi:hypothetical protein